MLRLGRRHATASLLTLCCEGRVRWQTTTATAATSIPSRDSDDAMKSSGASSQLPPAEEVRRLDTSSTSAGTDSRNASSHHQQHLSFGQVLRQELAKLPALFHFKAARTKETAVHLGKVMQGTDGTPETVAKEQQHKETYQKILSQKQQKAQEEYAKKLNSASSWSERLKLQLRETVEAVKQSTSKKSGVAALIQHCTAAHAAEVAVEQGIDVKNVQIVLEKQAAAAGAIEESKIVGYIDAPAASDEEVAVYAQRLTKACPAARTMSQHIEWRRR